VVAAGRRWSSVVVDGRLPVAAGQLSTPSSPIYRPLRLLEVAFLQQEKVEIDLPPYLIAAANDSSSSSSGSSTAHMQLDILAIVNNGEWCV